MKEPFEQKENPKEIYKPKILVNGEDHFDPLASLQSPLQMVDEDIMLTLD
jgi:hypothetical protein